MKELHQVLPTFSPGDAIGNETLDIRKMLRRRGYVSEIYAENTYPGYAGMAKSHEELMKINKQAALLYHYSIGSDLTHVVRRLPNRLCILYHNITPHQYFVGVNRFTANLLRRGREELPSLSESASLALAHSEFSRQELLELGFKNTATLPFLLDPSRYGTSPSPEVLRKYADDHANILFVGRYAPNKCLEDVMKIFGYYQKCIEPQSRLLLVGSCHGTETYYRYLSDLASRFRISNVHFAADPSGGPCRTSEFLAYYHVADVFLTMSEHEGFCVPLLESMHFQVPIIAYRAGAVPETLGKSGILILEKEYEEIGELVNVLVEDENIRDRVIERQSERLLDFDRAKIEEKLLELINRFLG
jgi:glycosyltransferase involved in cell wall biosynthesis